jgi:glycosyltransferase involved in cell wall biosynthesis
MERTISNPHLSIIIPCLNESETIGLVINKCFESLERLNLRERGGGEVIVADNLSTDDSRSIALALGAQVVDVPKKGYGAALIAGISAARGTNIVMGDADDSYELDNLESFIEKLDEGFDLVIGNRFKGGIEKGAMPWLHRYVGNPILSFIGRVLFKIEIYDFHCGLRAFNRISILKLNLNTQGMEFASEMIVKAALNNLKITEVPTVLRKDGRTRRSHLRTWSDGWRHLIFLLAASPRWLFLYPAVFLMSFGITGVAVTARERTSILGLDLNLNTFYISLSLFLTGFQILLLSILARVFAGTYGFLPRTKSISRFEKHFKLERGILIGIILICISLIGILFLVSNWTGNDFRNFDTGSSLRFTGFMILALSIGSQLVFASFLASLIQA